MRRAMGFLGNSEARSVVSITSFSFPSGDHGSMLDGVFWPPASKPVHNQRRHNSCHYPMQFCHEDPAPALIVVYMSSRIENQISKIYREFIVETEPFFVLTAKDRFP